MTKKNKQFNFNCHKLNQPRYFSSMSSLAWSWSGAVVGVAEGLSLAIVILQLDFEGLP